MPLHTQLVWDEVAKALTSKSWHTRHYVEKLLKSENHFSEDHLGRGLGIDIPPLQFLTWVRAKPEKRAAVAVGWLKIAERNTSGALSWHQEIEAYVAEFGDTPGVLETLARRLSPNSWSGSKVPYLEPIVPLLQAWLSHKKLAVRIWASRQIERLTNCIKVERKHDEEDLVRFF